MAKRLEGQPKSYYPPEKPVRPPKKKAKAAKSGLAVISYYDQYGNKKTISGKIISLKGDAVVVRVGRVSGLSTRGKAKYLGAAGKKVYGKVVRGKVGRKSSRRRPLG